MAFFNRKNLDFDTIVNVVVLEQTQNYSRGKAKAGLVFGDSLFNPDVVFMDGNAEPSGCTYTFSVTYANGKKEVVKADSGTDLCDRLLQLAMDKDVTSDIQQSQARMPDKAPELGKNQLPQGIYRIGEDIPEGTYDFHHVWGNGSLQLYIAEETILGNSKLFEWIGDRQEYEKLDCINVKCEAGWYLHVEGNLIVEIQKSKKVQIDL